MATFTAVAPRGTVIDAFAPPELMRQLGRDLDEQQDSFRTHILVSRGLGARAGETTAPTAQRVRRLGREPMQIAASVDQHLARAYRRAVGQVVPQARHASTRCLSVFALDGGETLRLDLAGAPALATDVTLTFICRPDSDPEATLRVACGPLTGCSQLRAPVRVPLKERQAALMPALWPAELLPASEPLFAVVVLVGVATG